VRHDIGDFGTLEKPLPVLCCGSVIREGTMLEIWKQHSPKRVWVKVHPAVPFLHAGHGLEPEHPESFRDDLKKLPQSGPIGDAETWPKAFAVHKVKASAIWFVGEVVAL
jgi:hypothetical protein